MFLRWQPLTDSVESHTAARAGLARAWELAAPRGRKLTPLLEGVSICTVERGSGWVSTVVKHFWPAFM